MIALFISHFISRNSEIMSCEVSCGVNISLYIYIFFFSLGILSSNLEFCEMLPQNYEK